MTYRFLANPMADGVYEPEGIYLSAPAEGECIAIQFWAENAEYYSQFPYNGVPLKGHNGIDFLIPFGTYVVAVDTGRVTEIGEEQGGVGRYLKVEHRWGESFYAHLDTILLDSGQQVKRGTRLALIGDNEIGALMAARAPRQSYLHFGIRIKPFNRFDGWGGFVDPLPYLNPAQLVFPTEDDPELGLAFTPHPMVREYPKMRRP